MGFVVTGISQQADVAALEAALTAAGIALEPLEVVDSDGVIAPSSTPGIASGNIGPIETGTGVPGLTSSSPRLGSGGAYLRADDSVAGQLAEYGIPDDEVDNYLEALAAGRFVIAYRASAESAPAVERAFASAGLAKVKRF